MDATIRFFGLDRLPEDLGQIGGSLRVRGRRDPVGGPVGVSARQVEKLITGAIDELRRSAPEDVAAEPADPLPAPADPFKAPVPPSARPALESLLWRAWAQIPDGERVGASALLHCEAEHGLRGTGPTPASRTERARWRRLAWSVLDVAGYRAARTDGGYPTVDRLMGPRFLALAEVVHADAITTLLAPDASVDAVEAAIPTLRAAVRAGLDEAPELLGIVRDALLRATYRRERDAPPSIESKLVTLSTILARERRASPESPSVVPLCGASTRCSNARRYAATPPSGRPSSATACVPARSWPVSTTGWGNPARRTANSPPCRRFCAGSATRSGRPNRAAGCSSSTSPPPGSTGTWPGPRAVRSSGGGPAPPRRSGRSSWPPTSPSPAAGPSQAQTQALAALLDRAGTESLLTEAHRLLPDLDQQSRAAGLDGDRAGRSTQFGVRLIGWRLALLQGNVAGIGRAQAATLRPGGALAGNLDTIERHQRAGARLGVAPDEGALQRLRQVPDRLRPRDRRAQWIRRH